MPGRVLVKLAPAVTGDVASLLAEGRQGTDATETRLGSLLRAHGVRAARRLFAPETHGYVQARAVLEARATRGIAVRRGTRGRPVTLPDLANVFILDLASDADVPRIVAALTADPAVLAAEPDRYAHAAFVPDDPRFTCGTPPCAPGDWQWALHRIRAPEAWERARGDGVVVAILDTGVNRGHLDLGANVWSNPDEAADGADNDGNGFVDDFWGWDFVGCNQHDSLGGPNGPCIDPNPPGGDADPSDDEEHGTAVAGLLGAVADNGLDMAGLAHGARVMAVRTIIRELRTSVSEVALAIIYAADNGAHVISMSLVGPSSALLADAVQHADSLGVLLVAAAGNSADQRVFYPAGYSEVIAVSSTNVDDAWSTFSSFGAHIELSAPGEQVLSILGLGPGATGVHGGLSGTSMSVPHVAGLAALLWSWNPTLSADEVRATMCAGAVDLGLPGRDPFFGCGRIDALRTLATQCIQATCGDGTHEPACGEECDDGNLVDGDCCSSTCRLEGFGPTCCAATRAARSCQTTLASRAARVETLVYREIQRCLDRVLADVASGRGTQRAAATCAGRLDPAATTSVLARARVKATEQIAKRCKDLTPADLDRPCTPPPPPWTKSSPVSSTDTSPPPRS